VYYQQLLAASQLQQQQMMLTTVNHCCQLLWLQQREIMALRSAVHAVSVLASTIYKQLYFL
jgi:IS30 family transposase